MTSEAKFTVRWNRRNQRWQWRSSDGRWRPYFLRDCPLCGRHWVGSGMAAACNECHRACRDQLRNARKIVASVIAKARKAGQLPDLSAGSIACVDCGRPAQVFDHRDYSRPMDVDPVCRSCNSRRGSANDVAHLRIRNRVALASVMPPSTGRLMAEPPAGGPRAEAP